jgi:uncharacterized protein (TIGR02284 family)
MSYETATLQQLLHALDDSSTLYRRLAPKTTSSHLKLLLERAVLTHQWIASELVERMLATGGDPQRGGSLLGPLHALRANWLARIGPDLERAYAAQALRCEDRVLQRFDEAAAETTDAGLRDLLQAQERLMENLCTQLGCLGPPVPVSEYTEPAPVRAAVRQPGPRATAQPRSRVQT